MKNQDSNMYPKVEAWKQSGMTMADYAQSTLDENEYIVIEKNSY